MEKNSKINIGDFVTVVGSNKIDPTRKFNVYDIDEEFAYVKDENEKVYVFPYGHITKSLTKAQRIARPLNVLIKQIGGSYDESVSFSKKFFPLLLKEFEPELLLHLYDNVSHINNNDLKYPNLPKGDIFKVDEDHDFYLVFNGLDTMRILSESFDADMLMPTVFDQLVSYLAQAGFYLFYKEDIYLKYIANGN